MSRRATLSVWAVMAMVIVGALAGCGSSGQSAGQTKGGTLILAALDPFTGPDADFGPSALAGCIPAAALINQAGGVLGHTFTCKAIDTRGDPADAVPAATQLLASTPNLAAIVGPTSDETLALAPILNAAKVPFETSSGQDSLDVNTWPYYYRLSPPDGGDGSSMALSAHRFGYKRAALLFGNDIGSQGALPKLTSGLKVLGSPKVVSTELIALDQTSYRTEIEKLIATRPDVILSETDGQTAATFFSEIKQLHGSLIPAIGSGASVEPTYCRSLLSAVGQSAGSRSFVAVNELGVSAGPGWTVYDKALLAHASQIKDAPTDQTDVVAQGRYDFVNLVALAMLEAKSTTGQRFNSFIAAIARPSPGAVKVHTFAEGKAALLAGKRIQYLGVGNGIFFDRYHNTAGGYNLDYCQANGNGNIVPLPHSATYTAADIAAIEAKGVASGNG